MGETMARIHTVSDEFATPHARKPLDLAYLLDRPLERIRRTWTDDRAANLDLVLTAQPKKRAKSCGTTWTSSRPRCRWGPIGGDFHQSSVYFNETNEPTFFNFDLCGPGWRAYDIAASCPTPT
jgi:Ser/Thr protein kinase RdoA (MazF antagonist)